MRLETPAAEDPDDYWNQFYEEGAAAVPQEPSSFGRDAIAWLREGSLIVDVGCGTGRDGIYFHSMGFDVVCIDAAVPAVARLARIAAAAEAPGLVALQGRAGDLPACSELTGLLEAARGLGQEISVYCRFLLHAITEDEEMAFFDWCFRFLKPGERVCLEYRARALNEEEYAFGSHFRRPQSVTSVGEMAASAGFSTLWSGESTSFSPFGLERPLVGRSILCRREDDDAS